MNTRHWPLYVGLSLLACLGPVSSLRAQEQEATTETLPEIIKRIQPSTVVVRIYDEKGKLKGRGSGFFISRTGHIITNRHVLEGASRAEWPLNARRSELIASHSCLEFLRDKYYHRPH